MAVWLIPKNEYKTQQLIHHCLEALKSSLNLLYKIVAIVIIKHRCVNVFVEGCDKIRYQIRICGIDTINIKSSQIILFAVIETCHVLDKEACDVTTLPSSSSSSPFSPSQLPSDSVHVRTHIQTGMYLFGDVRIWHTIGCHGHFNCTVFQLAVKLWRNIMEEMHKWTIPKP